MNQAETMRAVELVRVVRGAASRVLLVEHDMPARDAHLGSDRGLEFRREDRRGHARRDPAATSAVIEAYLGSEDEAIGM